MSSEATVKVYHTKGGDVALATPYHPDLPTKAKALGGRWNPEARVWVFDLRDEERVRALAREVYGTDGTPTRTVTVRWAPYGTDWYANPMYKFGREVATRRSRDDAVRLGAGVVVVEGQLPGRGGSAKHPSIGGADGVVFEIRDVPADLVVEDEFTTIVDATDTRRAALEAEIAALEAKVASLREELAEL